MSMKELDRSEVIRLVVEGYIKQKEAAGRLELSTRQVRNLAHAWRLHGGGGLIHGNRGRQSNRRIRDEVRQSALKRVRERYWDFGPTLAHEKLTEEHGFSLSVETLRQWMIADELWVPMRRKQARVHQMRERRPCFGELVQIDGSPHDWFEGRAPKCTLIVFIDDASSSLLELRFFPSETTEAYMSCLKRYLECYGRPVSFYSDRHGIFRVNQEDAATGDQLSQFGRSLKSLDIESIQANTPQAKGRVERANKTLQDRLVKEMRLAGVSSMQEGNAFLASYMEKHNQKFAVQPASDMDAHRPVLHNRQELDLILSLHSKRKLTKNLTLQYDNTLYQVKCKAIGYAMRGASVTVCKDCQGKVTLLYNGKVLTYATWKRGEQPPAIRDAKTLHQAVDQAIHAQAQRENWKPAPDHPWRKSLLTESQKRKFLSGTKAEVSTLG
ncbi:MAG: ISNCY family transposase [Mariprofundaceae bacterium]|nr:ISNCY family transposase [Mariprofundaceae bacterium]